MTLLAAEKISKKFKDQIILDTVSFTISSSEVLGLVGKNGVGKTTLLEILAGKQEADSGVINRSRNCIVDYIEQEKSDYLDETLFEFVAGAREDLFSMREEIRTLEHYLADNPHDRETLNRLGALQHRFETEGGFDIENEIKIILEGLGFSEERFIDRLSNFSGGEKNRAGLARLLAGKGNLLLLDEPTNHLDIESTTWLEEYLKKLDKACIIVSHDRAFLRATVAKIWEMNFGRLEVYHGSFENYLAERTERQRLAQHHYQHQQEEIKRIEEFIRRNMAGQKTKQAQSKLKYLNRIKRLPPPKSDERGPTINVSLSGRSYNHVLAVDMVTFGYGDTPVVEKVGFDIYRGDKIGLIGRNGSGKSTILKTLIGELAPVSGAVKLGNKVDVGYFDQELSDLNTGATILDNIWEVDTRAEGGTMRSFLARFGFTGEDVFKPVAALSGGEKTKLCLARLLYHPANFIILDEPTNHLDINAREALENALVEFDGCCLIVSHDRYFLDKVVGRIIHIDDGRVDFYDGNYSFFLEKTAPVETVVKVKNDDQKQAYLDFKEQSRRRARHKKEIEQTLGKIAGLEKRLHRVAEDINNNIPTDDWEQLQLAHEQKKRLENEILDLYARLEKLEAEEID
ncbi:MAG: ABC-F family ATP-binding cassette domain-containing protein [candidate division Zixibacteria bacterium]|nr:ABC-F family ATP-binding cassette domain-containing protein [candidate division Zixibacteria bacterium]